MFTNLEQFQQLLLIQQAQQRERMQGILPQVKSEGTMIPLPASASPFGAGFQPNFLNNFQSFPPNLPANLPAIPGMASNQPPSKPDSWHMMRTLAGAGDFVAKHFWVKIVQICETCAQKNSRMQACHIRQISALKLGNHMISAYFKLPSDNSVKKLMDSTEAAYYRNKNVLRKSASPRKLKGGQKRDSPKDQDKHKRSFQPQPPSFSGPSQKSLSPRAHITPLHNSSGTNSIPLPR